MEQPTAQEARKRGRKPDPAKRNKILITATNLFGSQGYSATSMFDVAKQANVSRVTVYSYYPDKRSLFEACLVNTISKLMPALFDLRLDTNHPKNGLLELATEFMGITRKPELVAAFRVMVGLRLEINFLQAKPVVEASKHETIDELEQISVLFHSYITTTFKQRIMDFLHAANEEKSLVIENVEYAAELFWSLFLDSSYNSLLLMGQQYPRPISDKDLCEKHINTFMRLYGSANGQT